MRASFTPKLYGNIMTTQTIPPEYFTSVKYKCDILREAGCHQCHHCYAGLAWHYHIMFTQPLHAGLRPLSSRRVCPSCYDIGYSEELNSRKVVLWKKYKEEEFWPENVKYLAVYAHENT